MAITYAAGTITVTGAMVTGTASSGGVNTLTDTTKVWTVDRYKFCLVEITSGTGSGQVRAIKSNTATALTLYTNWATQPDNTSVYDIYYDLKELVAAQPTYCAFINQSTIPRITVNSNLAISTNGKFGGINQHLHFVGNGNSTGTSDAGARFQFGELSADGSGKWGGAITMQNIAGGGGASSFVASTLKLYGVRVSDATPYIFGTDEFNLWQWQVGTTQDIRDCVFDKLAFWASASSTLSDNVWSECMCRFSGQPTTFSGNKFMGGGHIDMVVTQGAPQFAQIYGMKFRGDLDPTYRAFAMFDTTINHAYYHWDYDWGTTTILQGTNFYTNAPCNVYFGYQVGFSVKDSVGAVLASANVRLTDTNGDGAFVEPAGTAPYAPVRTAVYATDTNGLIASKKVLHYKLVASGVGNNGTQTTYTPMKLRARKYGYLYSERNGQSWSAPVTVNLVLSANPNVVATEAVALAYTGIAMDGVNKTITVSGTRSLQELYDYTQAWGATNTNMGYDEAITTNNKIDFILKSDWTLIVSGSLTGTGTVSGGKIKIASTINITQATIKDTTLDFTAVGTFDFRLSKLASTITVTNSSGSPITVKISTAVTTVNGGPNITLEKSDAIVINLSGMVSGSRYQLYNVNTSTELYNATTTGTEAIVYTYTTDFTARLRVMKTGYRWYEINVAVTASGASVIVSQVVDNVYNTNAIDGSIVTECSITGTTLRIFVNAPSNTTTWQRVYNWFQYYLSTALGIADQSNYITSTDAAYYQLATGFKIKNQSVNPLAVTGAVATPATGPATDIIDATGGSIIANTAHATVVSGTGATATEVRIEMDANSVKLRQIKGDTGALL